jgi:hypothetical protein
LAAKGSNLLCLPLKGKHRRLFAFFAQNFGKLSQKLILQEVFSMNDFAALKSEVFAKQKVLAKIYARAGAQSLSDYVRGWAVSSPSENTRAFFSQAQKLLLRVYPAELVGDVLRQTGQSPLVSTIDHHGILNHPFFVNSNLIFSQQGSLKYLLCLSTAGVSLNNSSWPGCLLLSRPDGRVERFSFFRDKIKTQTVLAVKSFNLEDVARVESHIKTADFLSKDNKQRLLGLTQDIFQDPKIFAFSDFFEQAARVSAALWEKVFPALPKLLYLPLEKLASKLVADEIAPQSGHILYKLFFTLPGWDSIEKHFLGSLGAFSGSHKGSFLFWGIDGKGRRIHLKRQKDRLANGNFVIPANAEFIINNLQTGKLYPTSLVCFLVLLYYGITCLGGFNQVNWLTGIKEKFIDLLAEWDEHDLADRIAMVPTENFAEGSLAFGLNQQGQIYKPTALDLFLRNDPGIYQKYRQLASQITLGESIDAALPEIYKVIIPAKDRNSNFLDITENDILNYSGLAGKIKSILGV